MALCDSKYGAHTLDMVKNYALEWESRPDCFYPRLFFATARDAAEARQALGSIEDIEGPIRRRYQADDGEAVDIHGRELVQYMVDCAYAAPRYPMTQSMSYNKFDVMRHGSMLVTLFDALMGTGELKEADERLLRAQMAFMGYWIDSPHSWDRSRGFASGGNQHLSWVCTRGMLACAMPDHPRAREWADKAVALVKEWVHTMVGENGVWFTENMHYANVSLSSVLPFCMAAQYAGFYNFLEDEKLRAWVLYIVKQLTPRDPRYENARSQPPELMRLRAFRTGLAGAMAKATARLDPAYSRAMQWAWQEQGYATSIPDSRFGSFEGALLDKSLPAEQPSWHSECFPRASAILRHGLGTPDEYYLVLPLCQFGDYYQPQPGGVTIYGKGKPLALTFSGAYEAYTAEAFLTNSVSMARTPAAGREAGLKGYVGPATISGFSAMPRQDYVMADFSLTRPYTHMPDDLPTMPPWPELLGQAADGGIEWKRQVLFVKGPEASDACYFLFRDTARGGQPTVWSMWSLSRKIGAPAQTENQDAFLSDAPGNEAAPARRLEGSRFTAVGQFDVDVDYFVALPRQTPRATVRWGYSTTTHWPNPWHEYQDLLHLQRTDDGAYYVALFPRRRGEPAPQFASLGDDLILKTAGPFGTDYAFLSATPTKANAEGVAFNGTAGSIQDRADGLTLAIGAKGDVSYRGYRLASEAAASLTMESDKAIVCVSHDRREPQTLMVGLPEGQALSRPTDGIRLESAAPGKHRLVISAGVTSATLRVRVQ